MLKFFLKRLFTWKRPGAVAQRSYDPLDHPAIAAMTLRQIADLPFEPCVCTDLSDERPLQDQRRSRRVVIAIGKRSSDQDAKRPASAP